MDRYILDICEGKAILYPCEHRLKEEVRPCPLVHLHIPLDYTDPYPTWDAFRRHEQNTVALKYCTGWAKAFEQKKDMPAPVLCGPVGTGKTRLVYTILHELWRSVTSVNYQLWSLQMKRVSERLFEEILRKPPYRTFTCKVVSMPQFAEDLRQRVNLRADIADYRKKMLDVDILVLDDIGAENMSDFVREELYLLVDKRVLERKPILATMNFSPDEMGTWLGERIKSRLSGASQIIEIGGVDQRPVEKERRLGTP